jgi:hypothetical protein
MKRTASVFLILLFLTVGGFLAYSNVSNTQQTEEVQIAGKKLIEQGDLYTKPSRLAGEGCVWKEQNVQELGLKFLSKDCENSNYSYEVQDNSLYLDRGEDEPFSANPTIEKIVRYNVVDHKMTRLQNN